MLRYLFSIVMVVLVLASCDDSNNNDPQLSRQEQLTIDTTLINQYIAENMIQNVQVDTSSALRYVIHEQGTGATPTFSDRVRVNYEGRLLDETVFDEQTNSSFSVSGVIGGWQVGIQKVQEGGRITLYMPSFLGYGPFGSGESIPPNAVLIFDIELLEVF